MEDAVATVGAVRKRVCEALDRDLDAAECLSIALASTLSRDRESVLGFLLDTRMARVALRHAESLALTPGEWEALLGADAYGRVSKAAVLAVAREPPFAQAEASLAAALRFTLSEAGPAERWKSAATRVACYLGLHSEECDSKVTTCLGALVRSDQRRLDEVRSVFESGGDELTLSKACMALAASYC